MKTFVVFAVIVLVNSLQAFTIIDPDILDVPEFRLPLAPPDNEGLNREFRITAANSGQIRYQARLMIDDKVFAGGSLISKKWVLTAASCVHHFRLWDVTLGTTSKSDYADGVHSNPSNTPSSERIWDEGRVTISSNKAYYHDDFIPNVLRDDIGLIDLPDEVIFNNLINAIDLPPKSYQLVDFTGKSARVSGWGIYSDSIHQHNTNLHFVDLTILKNTDCLRYFPSIWVSGSKYFCNAEGDSAGFHIGESGSPMAIIRNRKPTLLGVLSFLPSNGTFSKGYPAAYAAVPHYLDWISNITGIPVRD